MLHSIEDLADQNLPQAIRIHHRWQPDSRLLELSGVQMHQGAVPLPLPFLNCAIRLHQAVTPEQLVAQTGAFFGGLANPYAILTFNRHDADLEAWLDAEAYHPHSRLPTMLAQAPMKGPELGTAWRLHLATTAQDLEDFVQVNAQAYETLGLPPMFMPFHFMDRATMLAPDVTIALARDADGRAQATAMALHTGIVAGVYWVGTVPEARGKGLAAACTALVTNLALEKGAKAVTLQATHMGESVYRRLGYHAYGEVTRWSK
jgi:GNAT superfamily N-acetyltransferase